MNKGKNITPLFPFQPGGGGRGAKLVSLSAGTKNTNQSTPPSGEGDGGLGERWVPRRLSGLDDLGEGARHPVLLEVRLRLVNKGADAVGHRSAGGRGAKGAESGERLVGGVFTRCGRLLGNQWECWVRGGGSPERMQDL